MGRITTGFFQALGRFSAAHPWSHNEAYTPWIMRQARTVHRRGGSTALDVGCGTGDLLKKLARLMDDVTGIEPDGRTAARARANLTGIKHAVVHETSFGSVTFDESSFDFVTFVAAVHHLPLAQTLNDARRLVRPGGRVVIVGLARETSADMPWSVASMFLNPVVGAIRHPRRAVATPERMTAPTLDPRETFEQVAAAAQQALPGVKMRRGLFWRYTAVWIAPMPTTRLQTPARIGV
jgi:2-polyprenyl-3-methyl-5-hydroxy-6-metoxy-1,4-benzoquinol methylase